MNGSADISILQFRDKRNKEKWLAYHKEIAELRVNLFASLCQIRESKYIGTTEFSKLEDEVGNMLIKVGDIYNKLAEENYRNANE